MAPASAVPRHSDLLRLYLDDIGRYALLSVEDEQRLGEAIEAGQAAIADLAGGRLFPEERRAELHAVVARGQQAKNTFVSANLRLVVSIARRYRSSGLPILDLVQDGNLGLIRAVEKFDFRKGFRFSTYASWWIRQAITRSIANTARTIRLPVNAGAAVTRVQVAQAGLEADLGRRPTVAELATETGLGVNKVGQALSVAGPPVSIFEPIGDEGEGVLGDLLEDPAAEAALEKVMVATLPVQVIKLLSVLSDHERQVVCLRYGLIGGKPLTVAQVAETCGLSKEGIRQAERRALNKLRLSPAATGLADLVAG